MRIVFLDFDGVLNSRPFLVGTGAIGELGAIDPASVARLDRLVRETGAKVVISSAWRFGNNVYTLGRWLAQRGFTGEVIGMTPETWRIGETDEGYGISSQRGHEIQKWLDDNTFGGDKFVILDDNSDMAHLKHRLVQTDFDVGLTDSHVDAAIGMLVEVTLC